MCLCLCVCALKKCTKQWKYNFQQTNCSTPRSMNYVLQCDGERERKKSKEKWNTNAWNNYFGEKLFLVHYKFRVIRETIHTRKSRNWKLFFLSISTVLFSFVDVFLLVITLVRWKKGWKNMSEDIKTWHRTRFMTLSVSMHCQNTYHIHSTWFLFCNCSPFLI